MNVICCQRQLLDILQTYSVPICGNLLEYLEHKIYLYQVAGQKIKVAICQCLALPCSLSASLLYSLMRYLLLLLVFLFSCLRIKRLVSSADKLKEASDSDLCISLIKTRKSNGPRTLPCETPHVMGACLDVLPLIFTPWVLSEK